ncbi:MAG: succinate dehydrogenase / fumarate reductase cytochrome b subunit [Myxococcota bacterium]|jgi:succinate dehydrogenase / fumarate reductase cytochrome b subunit
MNPIARLYKSTIGKKVIMAVTGLIMVGWLLSHLAGNTLMFLGPEWMDAYAHKIHNLGPLLWVMRLGILGVVVAHIWSAVAVTRISYAARDESYKAGRKTNVSTWSARLMRVGGIIILLFIFWHLADLTMGWVHPDFLMQEEGGAAAYHNLSVSVRRIPVGIFYMVAVTFVGLHFSHGIQSGFQTLGLNHPKWNAIRKGTSWGLGALIAVGNIAIVASTMTHLIGGE